MVERRHLTPELVDTADCPVRGEKWIADTVVSGFGLRIWKTGKAFGIRVSDRAGRVVRKTYSPEIPRFLLWQNAGQVKLGAFLDLARDWARLEISRAKGLAPSQEEQDRLDEEEEARRVAESDRIGRRTFLDLASEFVETGPIRGWSQEYTDRMRSLLHAHVPKPLLSKEIRNIEPGDYESLLTSPDIGDSTAMTLRHLIHQIHRWIHNLGGPPYGMISSGLWDMGSKRPLFEAEAFARTIGAAEVEVLFETLDMHAKFPAVSLCIKTALLTRVPVSRCMRAEWKHIAEEQWYPWLEGERNFWWEYRRAVRGNLAEVLSHARNLWQGNSLFLFPSPHSPSEHIRRVDHVWSGALKKLNWPNGRVSTYARQSSHLRWIDFEWPQLSKSAT